MEKTGREKRSPPFYSVILLLQDSMTLKQEKRQILPFREHRLSREIREQSTPQPQRR